MTTPDQEALGKLVGLPVVVSDRMPKGQAYLLGDGVLLVPDLWRARWLVVLANLRRDLQKHLAETVRAAEERLGLLPCDHPRLAAPERDQPRCGMVVRCAVCGEEQLFVADEAIALHPEIPLWEGKPFRVADHLQQWWVQRPNRYAVITSIDT